MAVNASIHQRRSRSNGQALVEFALVFPILLLILIGIIDLGRAFHAYIAITNASREGARYATRPGVILEDLYENEGNCDCVGADCFDPDKNVTLKSKVIHEAEASGIELNENNICFYVEDRNLPTGVRGDPVRVTVRYELELILGWIISQPLQLSHYTEMLVP